MHADTTDDARRRGRPMTYFFSRRGDIRMLRRVSSARDFADNAAHACDFASARIEGITAAAAPSILRKPRWDDALMA